MTLEEFFRSHPRAALAYSGGMDSSYLLYAGLRCGADIRPYFLKTAFQPRFELEDARRLTADLGVPLTVVGCDILAESAVVTNPVNRCYYCKQALFSLLKRQALSNGYSVLLDGTNASDQVDDRPGMRALQELGVLSPLRLCGLTKDDIRQRSHEAGLFTWDKPAHACLATRIPTGVTLTPDILKRVETAETALADLGFTDFRIRVYHDAARIQLPQSQMASAIEKREAILAAVKPCFFPVLLDMEVRP